MKMSKCMPNFSTTCWAGGGSGQDMTKRYKVQQPCMKPRPMGCPSMFQNNIKLMETKPMPANADDTLFTLF